MDQLKRDADYFTRTHEFSGSNATADSLLLAQLMAMWVARLRWAKSYPQPPEGSAGSKRRPLIRLREYEPEEFVFEPEGDGGGGLDDDGLPHGTGVLRFRLSTEDVDTESCVSGTCDYSIVRINGTFRHGDPLGFAEVLYTNGDLLRANFGRSATLHGLAAKFNLRNQLLSVSGHESGVASGASWQLEPDYGAALFGPADPKAKGKVSGNDKDGRGGRILLCYYANLTDIFALTGTFENSILQGQGLPRRISKAWFTADGLMLHVEASADVMPFPSGQFRFRAGPNLSTREDRLYAQSAWLWNQRFDQMEPRGAVRMPEVLERQWREEANLTQAMPTHEDDACAELMMADPPIPGSIRERWLACFPGSGSKWLMKTVASAAALNTIGCLGPFRTDYVRDTFFLVKTHHQDPSRWQKPFSVLSKHSSKRWSRWPEELAWRMRDIHMMRGRAILLFRNPYDALISFWNHDRTNSYDGGPQKDGLKDLAPSLHTDVFRNFVKSEIKLWEEIYLDYLSVGSSLLVVHYEDMKRDMRGELMKIGRHLDLELEDQRLNCSLTMPHDRIKRKSKEFQDPYDQELRGLIEAAIGNIQDMLEFRNLPRLPVEKYKWR